MGKPSLCCGMDKTGSARTVHERASSLDKLMDNMTRRVLPWAWCFFRLFFDVACFLSTPCTVVADTPACTSCDPAAFHILIRVYIHRALSPSPIYPTLSDAFGRRRRPALVTYHTTHFLYFERRRNVTSWPGFASLATPHSNRDRW